MNKNTARAKKAGFINRVEFEKGEKGGGVQIFKGAICNTKRPEGRQPWKGAKVEGKRCDYPWC